MDSDRGEHLVIGYDLADGGDYSAITLLRRQEDGSLDVIRSLTAPGATVPRGGLLSLCLGSIRERRPRVVSVRVGNGELITISNQTIEEILDGRKEWKDLMIGSEEGE